MDVFRLHTNLMSDYVEYTRSFIKIADSRIHNKVDDALSKGLLWPEPLLQLNPSFDGGGSIDDLINEGILHPECGRIFRMKSQQDQLGKSLFLHRHQEQAIRLAQSGKQYVLTTGTGSGKSLAYIIPAVDYVLRNGSGKGIQAIIVYPMNALANSQEEELKKFLGFGYSENDMPVTFELYTGQNRDKKIREQVRENPPDILLTNYVMLELLLTRREESRLIRHASNLRFLVLDELHTYRGRQGADVAMLVRRCREVFSGDQMLCIGTSATMASGGDVGDQAIEVASVATRIFGSEVKKDQIISETLKRSTHYYDPRQSETTASLCQEIIDNDPPSDYYEFCQSAMASWIESFFGLVYNDRSDQLVRKQPKPIRGEHGAVAALVSDAGLDSKQCERALQSYLLAGSQRRHPEKNFPVFAFRLHQFISRGDTVWSTIEPEDIRHLELRKQIAMPGNTDRRLFPLVFCRECGQAYYRVDRFMSLEGFERLAPREYFEKTENMKSGYLYLSEKAPWPDNEGEILSRVPEDWKEISADGTEKIRQKPLLPENILVSPNGIIADKDNADELQTVTATFIQAPFRMCLNPDCQVAYNARQFSDRIKLNTLGVDTRSTATTILALRSVLELQSEASLRKDSRKLLSFTDNRQDASLQAGHFNDFSQIGFIRSALYQALARQGDKGLRHDEIAYHVFQALDLPTEQYASSPDEIRGPALKQTQAALRQVLQYYLYRDLERGWRLTSPNLEQCGLLKFEYEGIEGPDGLLADSPLWERDKTHSVLQTASTDQRRQIIIAVLDHLRRSLAIKVDALERIWQESVIQESRQRLQMGTPWYLDDIESLVQSCVAWPRSRQARDTRQDIFVSPMSLFGNFLRRPGVLPNMNGRITTGDTLEIIKSILNLLKIYGMIEVVRSARDSDGPDGYQLTSAQMIWKAGDGSIAPVDHLRITQASESPAVANPYFVKFYKNFTQSGSVIEAREHTAQVESEVRQDREKRFRDADLPVLFCSPTMELGVDIAQLNVVNMRNVPPTPANYAQRSGRAGRSGQPALVYTYCSGWSPHDQYYFKHPDKMVAGSVVPPRIDLQNQDLIRSHVHAIWLSESNLNLGQTLGEVLEVSEENLTLPLRGEVRDALHNIHTRSKAHHRAKHVLDSIGDELKNAPWYRDSWLEDILSQIPQSFDQACDRWRALYRSAVYQRNHHHKIIGDHSRPANDRDRSKRLRAEAETQIKILTTAEGIYEGDFYSYRYFASEGFLPGYNFPRLPLSAFIPGRRGRKGRDEFVSRPRFLAISEFGPRALIYHEGLRYRVNKVNLDHDVSSGDLATSVMKRCCCCGYGHFSEQGVQANVCDMCGSALVPEGYLHDLVRMQNASAKLAERITCDEEERQRMGYRIETAFRFAEDADGRSYRREAEIWLGDCRLGKLSYGDAVKIWRINVGWSRTDPKEPKGYMLDVDRGYWASSKQDITDKEDPMSDRKQRVVPFVEDYKNALVFWPENPLPSAEHASLQAALKEAIQQQFQLESSELAVLPIPDRDNRRAIFLYESSEGGAGVLRQFVDNKETVSNVARRALEICHFDINTGEDQASDTCGIACYDCLLDYGNQPDHEILNRHCIKTLLENLVKAQVHLAPGQKPRPDHLADLMAQCDSQLEKKWLKKIEELKLRLPSHAQKLIQECQTRPDFFYQQHRAAIYIDGPPHDEGKAKEDDPQINERMIEAGYLVIRFHHTEDWEAKLKQYCDIFGKIS